MKKRIEWAVACDRGGHLHNALMFIEQVGAKPDLLVVTPGPEVHDLRRDFSRVEPISYLFTWFGKRRVLDPLKIFAVVVRSAWLVLRYRPRRVVSFGASNIVPFCILARLGGARLYHVECMNQVESPSITGRMLYPFCTQLFVQWPELKKQYGAKASYAGWVLGRPEEVCS